jgi:hypothetical protein
MSYRITSSYGKSDAINKVKTLSSWIGLTSDEFDGIVRPFMVELLQDKSRGDLLYPPDIFIRENDEGGHASRLKRELQDAGVSFDISTNNQDLYVQLWNDYFHQLLGMVAFSLYSDNHVDQDTFALLTRNGPISQEEVNALASDILAGDASETYYLQLANGNYNDVIKDNARRVVDAVRRR